MCAEDTSLSNEENTGGDGGTLASLSSVIAVGCEQVGGTSCCCGTNFVVAKGMIGF